MDKTIQLLLVAVVGLIAAVIIVAMAQGQTDSFSGFIDNGTSGAQCDILKTQYQNKWCKDDGTPKDGYSSSSVYQDYSSNCGGPPSC